MMPHRSSTTTGAGDDIVFCSLESWDEVWRRNQYFVAGLLALRPTLRVLFVSPPSDPLHDVALRLRPHLGGGLRAAPDGTPRLWTFGPTKLLPRAVGPLSDWLMRKQVIRAAAALNMRAPLLWINDPKMAGMQISTGWPTIYDITDDWITADRPSREIERLTAHEDRLLERAAAVIACSPELVSRKATRRPAGTRPIDLVGNAVDVESYREPRPRPVDLPPGDCAIYVGTLHEDRLDVELCLRTAARLGSGASLVLVGPMHLTPENQRLLRAVPNIHVLGARLATTIPGYLQHAAALLVPHLVTGFTESLDPIKLYEYLAVGRPIVSTPVAGFRDNPAATIAEPADFPEVVASVVADPSARRRAVEHGGGDGIPTWEERVRAVAEIIANVTGWAPPEGTSRPRDDADASSL